METLRLPPFQGPEIQCDQCVCQSGDMFATGGIIIEQKACPFFASRVTWISEQETF